MAKHRRVVATRTPTKASRTGTQRSRASVASERTVAREREAAPPTPVEMPRKPVFYEAVTVYENGVRALQRHDFLTAAEAFRTVVQRFPEERELLERSQLYLRVCEREALQRPAGPQTAGERIYAATLALNAGDSETALGHLNRALDQEPNSDHAHYVLALTFLSRSQHEKALQHLRRAIELNPENRALARQDPDLRIVRDLDGFRTILEARPTIPKRPPVRSRKFEVRRKR